MAIDLTSKMIFWVKINKHGTANMIYAFSKLLKDIDGKRADKYKGIESFDSKVFFSDKGNFNFINN